MSCNHLYDCLRCRGIVEDLEDELDRLRARVAELEVMLPGQHTVGATICADDPMPGSLQSALAEAERGELLDMDDVIPPCTCCRKLDGPPTEPGWYWQVSTGTMFNGPRKIEQVDIDDGWPGAFSNEVTWYGPICEPDATERDER